MSLTLLYWILVALMLIGVVGTVIPGIPGVSLILASILVWSIAIKFAGVGWSFVVIFVILILSALANYLAVYLGSKQVNASKWAQFGAIAGIVFGFLGLLPIIFVGGPLFGVFFGAILGGFIGEFLYRTNLDFNARIKQAAKVSLGMVVGLLFGNIVEAFLAAIAVAIFIFSTFPPVG
jgi:uncharacterized protein